MTPKERLQTVLAGKIPDRVPVSPDFSNMIPAKRTGKPFWDIYLYNDPPIWEAYIDCAKHFGIDALMDGYFPLNFPEECEKDEWVTAIVSKNSERIVTQRYRKANNKFFWEPFVNVFPKDNPGIYRVSPDKLQLPQEPLKCEKLTGVKPVDIGPKGLTKIKRRLGDQGLVGVFVTYTIAFSTQEDIFKYYDGKFDIEKMAVERVEAAERRFHRIMSLKDKPDFLCVGGSGTLVYQTMDMFLKVAYPAVKRVIELAAQVGMPTHIHSCGPEKELVKLFAEETSLTVIDPLETPPAGDCILADLKKDYGDKIVLKGNLHTTNVMLLGNRNDVIEAGRKAISDAAQGGRFIL
ncbi:MAG: uroporphyrinogen decarboxylase family protein, partial [Phycisphaerales bacterium]